MNGVDDDSQQNVKNNVYVVTFKQGKHSLKEYAGEDYKVECDTYGEFKLHWCEQADIANVKDLRLVVNGKDVTDSVKNDNTPLEDIDFIQNASKIYIENKNDESYGVKNFKLLLKPGDEYLVLSDQADHELQELMINKYWRISQVKIAYTSMIANANASERTLHLIYDGNYLHNEYTINSCNIEENDEKNPIVAISSKKGAFSLRFMSWLREKDYSSTTIEELCDSLWKTRNTDHKELAVAVQRGKKKIEVLKDKRFKSLPECALMAIYLWTDEELSLYKRINSALEHGIEKNLEQDLGEWKMYLNLLDYDEPVYHGICGVNDLSGYKKGCVFCRKRFFGFSKNKRQSLSWMLKRDQPNHLLFEVNSIDGRYIAPISRYSKEEEVLFLPHSYFKILQDPIKMKDLKSQKEYFCIKLQQVQIPRSLKIVVWVDDNPQYNKKWINILEKEAISVVTCVSTADAISIIETYKWILMLRGGAIRIVTDMHRIENGIERKTAGIDLIKQLREKHAFCNDILIFTSCEEPTREHCEKNNAKRNVFVTTKGSVLLDFVSHKPIDKKRYGFDQ